MSDITLIQVWLKQGCWACIFQSHVVIIRNSSNVVTLKHHTSHINMAGKPFFCEIMFNCLNIYPLAFKTLVTLFTGNVWLCLLIINELKWYTAVLAILDERSEYSSISFWKCFNSTLKDPSLINLITSMHTYTYTVSIKYIQYAH